MLLDAWILTSFLTALFFFYNLVSIPNATAQGLRILNLSLADASIVLIGLSLALSGICHFWNFADTYIGYRKYLGLAGFYLAASHTLLVLSRRPIQSFLTTERIAPFVAAVVSIALFAIMAAISNTFAIKRLGYPHWKKILAAGYVAYLAALLHFGMIHHARWISWLVGNGTLEITLVPLSFIVFVFGSFVLGLRVALWIDTKK